MYFAGFLLPSYQYDEKVGGIVNLDIMIDSMKIGIRVWLPIWHRLKFECSVLNEYKSIIQKALHIGYI